jgi:hypothetical protein
MLRGNLATRPFYNERLVSIAIASVAVIVLLLMIFNASRLVALSGERRRLVDQVAADRAESARVAAATASVQQTVNRGTLAALAGSTREANDLIEQRTFSWTAFFELIERTLPYDVRLVAVAPRVERGVFKVFMTVVARSLADINTFVDALLGTGAFYDVAPTDQQADDRGTYSATIEASYLHPAGKALPPATGDGDTRP